MSIPDGTLTGWLKQGVWSRGVFPLSIVLLAATQMLSGGTPDTVRYRFETKSTSTVDLSAYSQPNREEKASRIAILSVTRRDSASGKVILVVIDSLVRDDGGAMAEAAAFLAPEMTASGKGVSFSFFLVGGKMKDYAVSSPTNLDATAISSALGILFPGMPTTTKVGETWTDTTSSGGAADAVSSSTEISVWTRKSTDSLQAVVTSNSTSMATAEKFITRATGTRLSVLDATGTVREGTLLLNSNGAMGTVRIKGVISAVLSRLP